MTAKNIAFRLCMLTIIGVGVLTSCSRSGTGGILGPIDETAAAGDIVADANQDLTKIKVMYEQNENKREELKAAMEANDTEKTKKIADDVVFLIADGVAFAESAVEKLQKAQTMQINDDYREYLQLKEQSLKMEIEAFDNYRQAAKLLRENYDPKNTVQREKVKVEFKTRSDNYQRKMEEAREYSKRANAVAKQASQQPQQ